MAPRAYWKGFLRLSLVQCPVALYPATTESEKIRFNQINEKTGNRIRYLKVDAESGEEVDNEDIVKGFEVAKGEYVLLSDEELESVALESKHIIEIDEFVPKSEIDDLYHIRPYYIAPDGNAGEDAFVVIRDIIARMDRVALGRIVITNREHVMALESRGKGLMGMLLRYPYEVRKADDFFDQIPDVKLPKDMFDLAEHIVKTKSGHFHPEKFQDHYENALRELINKKQKGERIEPETRAKPTNVVNLMDALRRSVEAEGGRPASTRRRAAAPAQRRAPRRQARSQGRHRKAG
jgi:DNA end-binding protein Ku